MSTPDVPPGAAEAGAQSTTSPPKPTRACRAAWLGAAAAAGLAVWLVMRQWYPFFVGPPTPPTVNPTGPSPEQLAETARLAYLNGSAVTGLAGGLFAAAVALCVVVSRGSMKTAVLVVLAGAVLGGAGGGAGGCCGQWLNQLPLLHELKALPLFSQFDDAPRTIAVQAACWGLSGVGIGLGLAIPGIRAPRAVVRTALGGGLGGIIAGLMFPISTALVGTIFPVGDSGGLVPDSAVDRILWLEIAAISIAIGIPTPAKQSTSR